jgi:hypothetical protein
MDYCFSIHSSQLKMKSRRASRWVTKFPRNSRRYISEDRTLHSNRCESLKSSTDMCIYDTNSIVLGRLPIHIYKV